MQDKVIEWFEKTGYPFELWAEAVLSDHGFVTTSSSLYHDEETDTAREIDLETELTLTSDDHSVSLSIRLLVECKKSDKPFILLRNSKKRKTELPLINFVNPEDLALRMFANNPNSKFKLSGQSGTGFKLIQAFATSDEVPYKAINSLIKCYNYFKSEEQRLVEYYINDNHHTILIPILLIDAPLLELTVQNNKKHSVRDLDCGMLFTLSNYVKYTPREFELPVTTKKHFEKFLQDIRRSVQRNLNYLIENPTINIKNLEKTEIKLVPKSSNNE